LLLVVLVMSDYEKTRQVNIARNRALLESLGLDKPVFEPKAKPGHVKKKASNTPKKRKAEEEDVDASTPKTKVQRTRATADVFAATAGVRRSQRNVGRSVDYTAERVDRGPVPIAIQSGVRGVENEGPLGRGAGSKRIHEP
jgi:E3 ubiquitin-protein ligase UHRF1